MKIQLEDYHGNTIGSIELQDFNYADSVVEGGIEIIRLQREREDSLRIQGQYEFDFMREGRDGR